MKFLLFALLLPFAAWCQLGDITDLSPLHEAVKAGNDGKVSQLILDDPARVHVRDGVGRWTPLHLAVQHGQPLIVGILLANGARPNVVDHFGWSPLLYAAKLAEYEAMVSLLDAGADPQGRDRVEGWTPMHWVTSVGMAEMLEQHGAKPFIRNHDFLTPLHRARDVNVARYFLKKGIPVEDEATTGKRPLHTVRDVAVARYLVGEAGAQVDARDRSGNTPLHDAARWDLIDKVVFLIQRGADASVRNAAGETPLHLAKLDVRVAQFLVAHDADVNAVSKSGRRPLHDCSVQVARYLLSEGAEVNAIDNLGQTALHRAARFAKRELMHALWNHSADLTIVDRQGRTALDEAIRMGEDEIAQELLTFGAVRATELAEE